MTYFSPENTPLPMISVGDLGAGPYSFPTLNQSEALAYLKFFEEARQSVAEQWNHLYCQILNLPMELLAELVELAMFSEECHLDGLRAALAISSTCRCFRQAFLTIPIPVEIRSVNRRSLTWPANYVARATRPFRLCLAASDPVDNVGAPLVDRMPHRARLSVDDTQDMRSFMRQLTAKKHLLKGVELSENVSQLRGWKLVVSGSMPEMTSLRLWPRTWSQPINLTFSAPRLTTLILRRCIPPQIAFPSLSRLGIHNLTYIDWPYGDLLEFLRRCPKISQICFEGDFFFPPSPNHPPVTLPNLTSVSFMFPPFNIDPDTENSFGILDHIIAKRLLLVEWTRLTGFGDPGEVDALPKHFESRISTVVLSAEPGVWSARLNLPGTLTIRSGPWVDRLFSVQKLYVEGPWALHGLAEVVLLFPNVGEYHVLSLDGDDEGWDEWSSVLVMLLSLKKQVNIYQALSSLFYPPDAILHQGAWFKDP